MDCDAYDKETVDVALNSIKFEKYLEKIEDSTVISVKNGSALEQITAESIVRIWKTIFRIYALVKNDETLQSLNILNYIKSELRYSNEC